ncbi:GNAT family N-acetyltransferase [Candidatus Entotheonella palauensis]|uniref:GNAT family N-acetyltransferase n=1 Tax=Candidatus Entotheonella palauensis TaxID=93172 RepID=UPI0015C4A9F8|nr:GNAT family N-acetyltransferase [Candidatus Entotheonella palauensis]
MPIELRPPTPDEFDAFYQAEGIPFGYDAKPEAIERELKNIDPARLLAAFDGTQIVATFGAFDLKLTVPGSVAPTAGTTAVTVLPTHRRRGILRQMMERHLPEAHERGELLAAPMDIPGTMRLVDREEALATFPAIYAIACQQRPGMLARSDAWWRHRRLDDPEYIRQGATAHRRVLYERDGKPLGYVIYRTRRIPDKGLGVLIADLTAAEPQAERALWQFVFGIDLVTEIRSGNRPVDDPLLWWMEQPRRMERRIEDSLWIRPIDVVGALNCRRYAAAGRVVFRMTDALCPWNEGIYRLEVEPCGMAECRRVDATPTCELTPFTLGAVYLGGRRFGALARAGLIAGKPESLGQLDAMFAWEPQPWCSEVF